MNVGRRGGWSGGCGYGWCRDVYASIWRFSRPLCVLFCLVAAHGGLDGLDCEQSRGLWDAARPVSIHDSCGTTTTRLARESGVNGGRESDLRGCCGEMIEIQGEYTRSSGEPGRQRGMRCALGCRQKIENCLPATGTIVSVPGVQVTRAPGCGGPMPRISTTTARFLERDCRYCC